MTKEERREYDRKYYQKHKEEKKQYSKQYREFHKEEVADYHKQYYENNKEQIAEQQKQYRQDNKEQIAEYHKQYNQDNKEQIAEYKKQYNQDNREQRLEYQKQWQQTPKGRASHLLQAYKQNDKKCHRENDLTTKFILEHIFTQPCHYCGETDWRKLGCDRIDNTIGHTENNVVPCCGKCNRERGTTEFNEFYSTKR